MCSLTFAMKSNILNAVTVMGYFARSEFFKSLVQKKNLWLDMTISVLFRILISSREAGYLFSVEMNSEKSCKQ